MAMIFSEKPCVTAGTFTTNKVFAAPVKWVKILYITVNIHRLLLLTVCCQGLHSEEGDNACLREAQAVSKALGIPENSVLVASTRCNRNAASYGYNGSGNQCTSINAC